MARSPDFQTPQIGDPQTTFTGSRPNHFGALNAEDLRAGMRVIHYNSVTHKVEGLYILVAPDLEAGTVLVYNEATGKEEAPLLTDLGLAPYPHGLWNLFNHVTAAPTS